MSKHDLHYFMNQLTEKMSSEYQRIKKSSSKDPGTAGDEGEADWAALLEGWLPPQFKVVTKGQLIDIDGELSPQVDIIILKPSYPPFLYDKKKYLIDGVIAVFECKLNLRKNDIYKFIENSVKIKRMPRKREGTPYKELFSQPLYGLLAHTSSWGSAAIDKINENIKQADLSYVKHPREMPDIICVSDLATWATSKIPEDSWCTTEPHYDEEGNEFGVPHTSYMCNSRKSGLFGELQDNFNAIGFFFTSLFWKLSYESDMFKDFVGYFFEMEFSMASSGPGREWGLDIYSDYVMKRLKRPSDFEDMKPDDEWLECYD